jgi:hypothetical protein
MSEENGTAPEPVRYYLIRGKRYDMPGEMTGREYRYIRQETGALGGAIGDGMEAGDSDMILCLAVVAMRRAGESVELEDLLDLKIGGEGELEVKEDVEEEEEESEEEESERPTEEAEETASPPAEKPGRRRSSASTA